MKQLEWARYGPNGHWRAEFTLDPIHFRAEIVPNTDYGGEDDAEGRWMLVVVAEVWDIDAYDEQVGFEQSPLPEFDADAEDPNGAEWIDWLALDFIASLNVRVHADVRRELANTEQDLKRLRAIERKMSRVTMSDGNGHRVTLTPELAQMVLALRDRKATIPWRIELESANLAACYNDRNQLLGRIIYRPEDPDLTNRAGRYGLFPVVFVHTEESQWEE